MKLDNSFVLVLYLYILICIDKIMVLQSLAVLSHKNMQYMLF